MVENFKPLHDLAKKIEDQENVTEAEVAATIKTVRENLSVQFHNSPERLTAIHKHLDDLETLWKESIQRLKIAGQQEKQGMIHSTKEQLAQLEAEVNQQLPAKTSPNTALQENQARLTAIAGEKDALIQASLSRTNAAWTQGPKGAGGLMELAGLFGLDVGSFIRDGLQTYEKKLNDVGLNDDANKKELAEAMEMVAKEYIDNGGKLTDAMDTAQPLITLLNSLKDYYEKNKGPESPYTSPNAMLRRFSEFTGTNFINNEGKIQRDNLGILMRYSAETLKMLTENFEKFADREKEEKQLSATVQAQIPAVPAAAPTTPQAAPTTPLSGPATVSVTAQAPTTGSSEKQLPSAAATQASPQNQPASPLAQPESPPPQPEAPPAALVTPAPSPTVPGETPSPAGTEKPTTTPPPEKEALPSFLSTGNPETDKIVFMLLPYIVMLFPKLAPILEKMGATIDIEFPGLKMEERKEAGRMKKTMGEMGLNLETLKPLFNDKEQMRRVLAKKKVSEISWGQFLKKNLSPDEKAQLKTSQTFSAKAIADMLIPEPQMANA